MKNRLSQYRGVLNSGQIADGMNAATKNALRLAEDARSMLEHSRHPSAVGLAILSIEESGKNRVLRELALASSENQIRAAWREYRQRTSKNQLWLLIDSFLKGSSKLHDFRQLFDADSEHPQILDNLKQVSLYTDCLGIAHWSLPEEAIDAKLAEMLVGVAEVLCQSHQVTAEEIDLWIYYMQPVFRTTAEAMEGGLIAWDKEMRSRGLIGKDGPTMEEFVRQGLRTRTKS